MLYKHLLVPSDLITPVPDKMIIFFQVSFCRNSLSEQEKVRKTVLDEINLLYRLRHPHVVQCLGATQHLGHFNIFMEIMPGIVDLLLVYIR